jgi:SH3 domain protein
MNIPSISFKNTIKHNFICLLVILIATFSAQAQENQQGFISDDLTIFMHAGPGTNYRILGTINAGAQVQTTGKSSNDYSEIIDDKNRVTWVETQYITRQPGLRFVVSDLNGQLASNNDNTAQLDGELNELKSTIDLINKEKEKLQAEFSQSQQQLKQAQSKVKDQDTNIKKQWFFNGAIVLGIGLILGLILPKFFARRRSQMDNWS